MELILELKDDQYEYKEITHIRKIARAVVLNNENKIALIHVKCDDIFGHRDYYELPGGGVNENEDLKDAVIREVEEEIGYTSKIICELGKVVDYYNLIKRCNHSNYFLVRTLKKTIQHLEEYEKDIFENIVWVGIDEAILLMNAQPNYGVNVLVKRREVPILKLAKELIKNSLQKQDD